MEVIGELTATKNARNVKMELNAVCLLESVNANPAFMAQYANFRAMMDIGA